MTQNQSENEIVERLSPWFTDLIDKTIERDPEKARAGRAVFLARADQLSAAALKSRNKFFFEKRQHFFMGSLKKLLITVSLFLVVLFAGTTVTVYAAQFQIPNDNLYALKLISEEFRLRLAIKDDEKYRLSLAFANRRIDEMVELFEREELVPVQSLTNWANHMREAYRLVGQKPLDLFMNAVSNFEQQMMNQELILTDSGIWMSSDAVITQVRTMIGVCIQNIRSVRKDPEKFHSDFQKNNPFELFNFQTDDGDLLSTPVPTPGKNNNQNLEDCDGCNLGGQQDGTSFPSSSEGIEKQKDFGPENENCYDCDPYGPSDPTKMENPWATVTSTGEAEKGSTSPNCQNCNSQDPGNQNIQQKTVTPQSGQNGNYDSNATEQPGNGGSDGGGPKRP